jgi:hypothetical protein
MKTIEKLQLGDSVTQRNVFLIIMSAAVLAGLILSLTHVINLNN